MSPSNNSQRVNTDLLRLIPADAKVVIEFGCGAGGLADQFKRINPHVHYIGVDANAIAIQQAATRLDHAVVGTADSLDWQALGVPADEIDCLIYNNVLERLVDPWTLLQQQTALLKPETVVVGALWNVQHWTLLVQLLRGQWPYQSEGLLDRNNLRFFTLDSVSELFTRAGLHVFDVRSVNLVSNDFQQFQQLMAPILRALNTDVEQYSVRSSSAQYIVRGQRGPLPPRRLRIHTMMLAPLACDRLRVLEPDQFTNTIPAVNATSSVHNAQLPAASPDEDRVFIIQRANMRFPTDLGLFKNLLQRGYLMVAEMDDDPNRWPSHGANRYISFTGVHCVQTSTEPLGEYLRTLNPHVGVFANQIANLPPPREYNDNGPLRLFFGALNREGDWAPVMAALNRVLNEYKERVWVHVLHDQQFFNALTTPFKSFEQFVIYERYLEIMHECEIALLPLEPTRFNSMKSDLKFLECSAHGVAALASPTVYERTIQEGETGLIYRDAQDFETKLRALLEEKTLRRGLATKAYAWVKANRLMAQHYRKRSEWYKEMLGIFPQLQEELKQRVPELFQ